jgi:hypothetical protein
MNSFEEGLRQYNKNYLNYCITGYLPKNNIFNQKIHYPLTFNQLKSQFIYSIGYPRISSTPLGMNSLYNRYPHFNLSQYQTT